MLNSKSLLITGCSTGIGYYCAHAAKKDGWNVLATARKPEDVERLKEEGLNAFRLDYTDKQSMVDAVNWALEQTGGTLDAVFQNGAYAQAGAVEDLPTDALRQQFETNFFGWHELNRLIVPLMRAQNHGRIIFCSSILGVAPMPWRGAYNASKFALEGLMLTMRQELHDTNIEIAMIEPGPITSKIAQNSLPHFEKHIDVEKSPFADQYEAQFERMGPKGSANKYRLGPEAVYDVLDHALTSKSPKIHYPVTTPAKFGFLMRRFFPEKVFHNILRKGG